VKLKKILGLLYSVNVMVPVSPPLFAGAFLRSWDACNKQKIWRSK